MKDFIKHFSVASAAAVMVLASPGCSGTNADEEKKVGAACTGTSAACDGPSARLDCTYGTFVRYE